MPLPALCNFEMVLMAGIDHKLFCAQNRVSSDSEKDKSGSGEPAVRWTTVAAVGLIQGYRTTNRTVTQSPNDSLCFPSLLKDGSKRNKNQVKPYFPLVLYDKNKDRRKPPLKQEIP